MGSWTTIRFKAATGVAFGDGGLVATTLAWTPTGVRQLASVELPVGENGREDALRKLRELVGDRSTFVVGLDARDVFFSNEKDRGVGGDDVRNPLPEHLRAAAHESGGFVAAALERKIGGDVYRSVAACRRDLAREAVAGLDAVRARSIRLEPAPFALLRLARQAQGPPRAWRTTVHVLLQGTEGLALLAQGKALLAWRPFRFAHGQVEAVVLGLIARARAELDLRRIDGVLLHADERTAEIQTEAWEVHDIATRVGPPVPLDGRSVSAALAASGLKASSPTPNLAAELRSGRSTWAIFPWASAAMLCLVALGAGWLLGEEAAVVEAGAWRAELSTERNLAATGTEPDELLARHEELMAELAVAEAFVDRVRWAPVLREVPRCLPASAVLDALRGRDALALPDEDGDRPPARRELQFHLQARLAKGATPSELDQLNRAVRASETLRTEFPKVQGADVNRQPGPDGDLATLVVRYGKGP